MSAKCLRKPGLMRKQWDGWGTALKPAFEPIVLARKPLRGTVAANVLAHGPGALNIGACRLDTTDDLFGGAAGGSERPQSAMGAAGEVGGTNSLFEGGTPRLSPESVHAARRPLACERASEPYARLPGDRDAASAERRGTGRADRAVDRRGDRRGVGVRARVSGAAAR